MFYGIKNTNVESGTKYSSLTNEEKMKFQIKVLQDGVNFSTNFSNANFVNYNNLSMINTMYQKELKKAAKVLKDTKFDENKKKELLELARNQNQSLALPLNMYTENEIKFYKAIIIPYVQKENAAKEAQKNLFNFYQNYIIYKDISKLWMIELDAANKFMMFEKYRKGINSLGEIADIHEGRKEEAKKNRIKRIQRRIKLHIVQNKTGKKVKETKEETLSENKETEKSKINFDDWL